MNTERLNRVASRKILRLTHYGRKSGKPYEVTIWFVVEGDRVYVGTANINRQWVHNVQKTAKVSLTIGGEKFDGEARFLADRPQHKRVQSLMLKKYWMFSPILAIGRVLMATGILRDHSGSFEVALNE
jgi:deazaflavin-dependent oxidoreductase (nitroreductase family)